MIKTIKTLNILFAVGCVPLLHAQTIPEPTGRRLRNIVKDGYKDSIMIGATTGAWAFDAPTGRLMDREFSYVTPENDFKQNIIHPNNSDTWNWSKADAWISHIAQHDQKLRIHGPISPQCSAWAKTDTRTAAELEQNMRNFMTQLCKRYNGKPGFVYMDVVNETVNNDGTWFGPKPGTDEWENPWPIIGSDTDTNHTPLYIKYSFEIAKQYAPDLKLIYNQHGDRINPAAWNKIKQTVGYLRSRNLRVDGIGFQAHMSAGWEIIPGQPEALRNLIDWAHANDLEFHVTEQSVWLKDGRGPAEQTKQAATYRAIIEILLEKRATGKVIWNTWHIDDGSGWKRHWYPSLFDENYRAKPAYYAVQQALEAGIN